MNRLTDNLMTTDRRLVHGYSEKVTGMPFSVQDGQDRQSLRLSGRKVITVLLAHDDHWRGRRSKLWHRGTGHESEVEASLNAVVYTIYANRPQCRIQRQEAMRRCWYVKSHEHSKLQNVYNVSFGRHHFSEQKWNTCINAMVSINQFQNVPGREIWRNAGAR